MTTPGAFDPPSTASTASPHPNVPPAAGQSPAGWFADHWQPGRLRYWDGAVWTGFLQPTAAGQPSGRGLGGRFASLAGWLTGLLVLNAVVAAATLGIEGGGVDDRRRGGGRQP